MSRTGSLRHTIAVAVVAVLVAGLAPAPAQAVGPGIPFTWGGNPYGQLGDGTTTGHAFAAPILSLADAIDIGGGREHAVALLPDGRVWTWGRNNFGQIGDGTTQARSLPTLVAGITGVLDIGTGHYHTLAIRSDGTAWGWGYNALGQLGDGTTTNRRSPVRMGTLTGVAEIAGGRSMSYALLDDGTLWACGSNANGQLGDGTRTTRTTPVRVGALTNVVSFAGGRDHGLAVRGDGSVWAWGDNAYGQIGDGTVTDRVSPVRVGGIDDAVAVTAGAHHSIALLSDGSVLAWGRNYRGQLGDGSTTARRTPVPVLGLTDVVAIGAGRDHNLAVLEDGTARAWGLNDFGQLGDGTTTNRTQPVVVSGLSGAVEAHGGRDYSVAMVVDADPDVTPPTAPGQPSGQSTTPGAVDLTWTSATDDVSTTLTYRVFRDGVLAGTTASASPVVSFSDLGLQGGTSHRYTVTAVDAATNEGPASAPSDPITVASGPPVIFSDDFASGTLGNWAPVNGFAIDGGIGSPAAPSARASVTAQTATMARDLGASLGSVCMSARVNVSTRTGSMILWRLRTAGDGPVARALINSSGILAIRSDVSGATRTSGVSMGTGWHLIELCGSVGTVEAWSLYRDGVQIVSDWVANTGAVPIGRLEIGSSNAGTWTANFDDVVVDQAPG